MSIFYDMHPNRSFQSLRDFDEVNRMLREAIERGHVEVVTPLRHPTQARYEDSWYRDKETGEIYRMCSPEPPATGVWEPVDLDNYLRQNSYVQ